MVSYPLHGDLPRFTLPLRGSQESNPGSVTSKPACNQHILSSTHNCTHIDHTQEPQPLRTTDKTVPMKKMEGQGVFQGSWFLSHLQSGQLAMNSTDLAAMIKAQILCQMGQLTLRAFPARSCLASNSGAHAVDTPGRKGAAWPTQRSFHLQGLEAETMGKVRRDSSYLEEFVEGFALTVITSLFPGITKLHPRGGSLKFTHVTLSS